MKNKTRTIALDALFIAVILILTFVPYIGFIPLGAVSITTITIPVFVGAYILGWKRGMFYGLIFGLSSFTRSFMSYVTPADPLFQNPLVSILPRVLFGLFVGLIYYALKKIENEKKRKILIPVFTLIGSLFHSIVTLLALCIFNPTFWPYLLTILGTNSILEAVFAAITVPLIIASLRPYVYKYNENLRPSVEVNQSKTEVVNEQK